MALRESLGNRAANKHSAFARKSIKSTINRIKRQLKQVGAGKEAAKIKTPNFKKLSQNQIRRQVGGYQNTLRAAARDNRNASRRIHLQAVREREKKKQENIRLKKAAEKEKNKNKWIEDFNKAQTTALERAPEYFDERGVNSADYEDEIQQMLDDMEKTYKVGSDFKGAFDDLGQRAFDNETADYRDRTLYDVNNYFKPDLGLQLVSDTADDAAIEEILSRQYDEALATANRARDRNQLNETGFNALMQELGRQRDTGQGLLNELGKSQVGAQRSEINNLGSTARDTAANINLNQDFSLDPYKSQVQQSLDDFMQNIGSNLSSQAGDLFNFGDAFSKGAVAQGAQNLNQRKPNAGVFTGQDEEDEGEARQAPVGNIF